VLGRPIGLSGSGPTLWTLYPSLETAEAAAVEVRRAVADGSIPTIGEQLPTIIATTIASPATSTINDQRESHDQPESHAPGDDPVPDPIANEVPSP